MKILIFGSSGFLGKELTKLLRNSGYECFTVSRSSIETDFVVDISKFHDFYNLPKEFFNVIINCATILPGGDYLDNDYLDKIYKTNILGTQNICKWINQQKSIRKIVNCSTLVVVDKPWPINLSEDANTYPTGKHVLYSFSKLAQELFFTTYVSNNNIVLSQIRFSALYGENMNSGGIINTLINQLKSSNIIKLTNAQKVNADFLYVDDAAKIILATINNDYHGILNGATGVETSILHLAEIIKKHFNDESIQIENSESMDFIHEDRAVISVEKLSKIVDVNNFTTIDEGIKKMLS
jgi:UDP-glucose 4-epimerase